MPRTLTRDISPPVIRKSTSQTDQTALSRHDKVVTTEELVLNDASRPSLSAIEAGQAQIRNHLEYFTQHFIKASRPLSGLDCRLSIDDFQALYRRNQQDHGRHFVIHQHDHPIAGVHYDLRLQFSKTSTVSWSVPYGIPGNPNSVRPNRMAVETRIHTLWNNLVESASHATGSLLIWDTGEYEVLPRQTRKLKAQDTDDDDDYDDTGSNRDSDDSRSRFDNEKLIAAFRSRYIKLRLHGSKLPNGYTVSLRLPLANDRTSQPKAPKSKRRRLNPADNADDPVKTAAGDVGLRGVSDGGVLKTEEMIPNEDHEDSAWTSSSIENRENQDEAIRRNNAYPGANNSIGSIHQRQWFLTLDRTASGLHKPHQGSSWQGPWEPFFVYGRDVERSVVTGRSADEVMADENVQQFAGRKMWRPILE